MAVEPFTEDGFEVVDPDPFALEATPTTPSGRPLVPLGISGRRKAAILLVSLGTDRAAQVFKHLRDEEIEALTLEMAKLGQVQPDHIEGVFEEAAAMTVALQSFAEGGVEFAREVLERSLGADRAEEIIGRLASVIEMRPFEFLRRTPPEQVAAFLRAESPQTRALVIANLSTRLASQVLAGMEPAEQADIALRVGTMSETNPEVVKRIEAVVRNKVASVIEQDYQAAGGVDTLAQILNNTDRGTERNVLDALAESDPELAEEVRRKLFVFEDVAGLDDRSIQLVLRDVEQRDLALALRGVDAQVQDRILANLSQRAAEMLRDEMEFQPPQLKRVVEEAQGRIVAVVRRLEEAGTLVIGRGNGDDMV
ncbi:flagellar motor switch protein FliG [Patulibacter brassicae]|jgi:flagellar motor switch protein FliG|uniref:Flagellar motor switch protein FliG n=1 Tax=Patulibacter brassicae TaxID=1705717 RepID=A0ABU4VQQ5_9ACTN|nr:flagellar motor switch protein FliG [Patulibacter brassicae]MDX8153213.1 flagellar motor switch protein FliG [Patulibacter brassicae]